MSRVSTGSFFRDAIQSPFSRVAARPSARTMHSMGHYFTREKSCRGLIVSWVLIGSTRNLSGLPQVTTLTQDSQSISIGYNPPQSPSFQQPNHSSCHLMTGYSHSPQFPSTLHLSPARRLLSSMSGIRKSYCELKNLEGARATQDASLRMGPSSRVEHWRTRFAFGRIHPPVIRLGPVSKIDWQLSNRFHSRPLRSQYWLAVHRE